MIAYDQDVAAVQSISAIPIILDTVCRLTKMGFAAVARVTDERWIACSVRDDIAFGLPPGGELPLDTTICDQIRQSGEPVIISDVASDAQYRDHHTPAVYGFRSYVSMPIVLADGRFFGTLCAIDPQPRDLHRIEVRDTFRLFADLIGQHLDIYDRLVVSEGKLATEIETGELREEFIAVLGHDLRNPLASVQAGVTMLNKAPDPERSKLILGQMQGTIERMGGMIDNVLDFAQGRLGGGISLDSRRLVDVAALAQQVVQELGSSHADREIVLEGCDSPCMVDCDPRRLAQMLSNLVGNALTHGDAQQPITVTCAHQDGSLTLAVANGGEAIPDAARDKLFHPFFRAHVGKNREGLGLGLYIAAQIARAHGGDIALSSAKDDMRFIITIPAIAF